MVSGDHLNGVEMEKQVSHNLWRKRARFEALVENATIMIGNLFITPSGAFHKTTLYTRNGVYWYPTTISVEIGSFISGKRTIADIEWIDDRNVILSVVIDGSFVIERETITLPELDDSNHYRRFSFDQWFSIAILDGTVSNLSVCYEKELTSDYIEKSWDALSTVFLPYSFPSLIEMSDNVDFCRILSDLPNSALHQFDTFLVRGCSQRFFSLMETSLLDNGHTEICLWLNTIEIDTNGSYLQHDFSIGDVVYIDGFTQNELNGCWTVEKLGQTSIYFSTVGVFNGEVGYFLIKRPPIGGGAWLKNNNEYYSDFSTLNKKLIIDDKGKTSTSLSIKDQNETIAYLRRYFKRSSTHRLGGDLDTNRIQWSILGDHLRFILVVAYKQNPKSHCRIIGFGDFTDLNDNTLKTLLIGYSSDQLGDVGFNKIFELFSPIFTEKGFLELKIKNIQPSGIGMINSNRMGVIDYIKGSKDCGLHRYPVLIPFDQES